MWSSHVYFNLFFSFVRCIEDRSQYYRIIFNTHLFSNVVIMTLNYVLCPILVHNPENSHFESIYVSPASTHINEKHHYYMTLPLYHLHTVNIEIRGSFRCWPIVVREILTLI